MRFLIMLLFMVAGLQGISQGVTHFQFNANAMRVRSMSNPMLDTNLVNLNMSIKAHPVENLEEAELLLIGANDQVQGTYIIKKVIKSGKNYLTVNGKEFKFVNNEALVTIQLPKSTYNTLKRSECRLKGKNGTYTNKLLKILKSL